MTTFNFLMTYVVPFIVVSATLGLNEYRLLRIKSIDYKSFSNGIAVLIIGLISFICWQVIISNLVKFIQLT